MLEIIVFFFAIPLMAIAYLGVSIYRYASAKRQNKLTPGSIPPEEIKRRLIRLIVSAIVVAVLVIVVIGIINLFFMAVAYM